jgi:outer membrane translocation and assembly module TamA
MDDFASDMEAGAGFGFRVNTPIGPVRIDIGFPITQLRDEEQKPRLHFNLSRSF